MLRCVHAGCGLKERRLDMSHEFTVREDGTEEFFAAGRTPV